jgi:hypothetical protein
MIHPGGRPHPIAAELLRLGILVALAWATVLGLLPAILDSASGR